MHFWFSVLVLRKCCFESTFGAKDQLLLLLMLLGLCLHFFPPKHQIKKSSTMAVVGFCIL